MIFGVLNPEKIWHQQLGHLLTSPVYCSHCTLGNPEKSFFNSIHRPLHTCTSAYLRYLRRKQTVTHLPTTPENVTALPCKMHKFTSFFHFFSRASSTNLQHGRVAEVSCCDVCWISAQHGRQCNWSVAKKTESMYPCRRRSLWTCCDAACLTFHLPQMTTGSSREPPMPTHNRFFQSHQRLEKCNIRSVRWKSCAFYKVVRWHFQVVNTLPILLMEWGKEIWVIFVSRK